VVFDPAGIIGTSSTMQEIFEVLNLAAPSDATILILGETGTGKELLAQAIHRNSHRRHGPFVVVNCAAIPETLIESELFGHEKGAFTGATNRKLGRFAIAHDGTIFLDEIGDLPLATQSKILRVLQSKEYEPLGSNRTQRANVRIISATNRPLDVDARSGRFREDLFYRLNVVTVTLPPLRERVEDIPLLAYHFLQRFNEKNQRQVKEIDPRVLQVFRDYAWPGNIRELENVIERGVIFCKGDTLTLDNLPALFQAVSPPAYALGGPPGEPSEPSLLDYEKEYILRTFQKVGKDVHKAAEKLGISLEELSYRLRAYHIDT